MKNIIIILFILLFLFMVYNCYCYKNDKNEKEGFMDRYSKNTIIDLLKGVDENSNRRDTFAEGVNIDTTNYIHNHKNSDIFEPTLEKDEYILGSIIGDIKNIDRKDDYPHKLNYVYEVLDNKATYYSDINDLKNLKNHKDLINLPIKKNINSNNYKNFKNYLDNKFTTETYYKYKTDTLNTDFTLEELLGFKEPNITNLTQMNNYVNNKLYTYTHEVIKKNKIKNKIKNNIDKIISDNGIDRDTVIIPGIDDSLPYLRESSLYRFLNINQIRYEGTIKKLNILKTDNLDDNLKLLDEFKLYIYYFIPLTKSDALEKIKKIENKKTDEFKDIIKKQTTYLFENKVVKDIQKNFPDKNTDQSNDYNLYYHYYEDEEDEDENKTFRYLGGIFSHNPLLSEEDKNKILKIPNRCLKQSTTSYSKWFDETNKLAIHPTYQTIIKVETLSDKFYELKPCVQLQTTFKERIQYYNNIKSKCKDYSKLKIDNPIFNKVSDEIHQDINAKKISDNNNIIKKQRELLKKLQKEDIIKNNINRNYNRSRLNKYLNKKEENLYILNKKLRDGENSFDLNLYYSESLEDCLGAIKKIGTHLTEEQRKEEIAQILLNCKKIINEKKNNEQNAQKEILKRCTQPGIIRKDEVPCYKCTDYVID